MIQNEQELFDFLKARHIKDLEPSEHKYSKYDCYSESKNIDLELKCRQAHYDDLLIEKDKYDSLLARATQYGTKPYYVNSTPEGIFVFNLSTLPTPEWEVRLMPKTSHFSNREKVEKVVGYLSIKKGLKLLE